MSEHDPAMGIDQKAEKKKKFLFFGTSAFIGFLCFLYGTCSGVASFSSAMSANEKEAAKNAPEEYIQWDDKVSESERKSRYQCLVKHEDDEIRIQMDTSLLNVGFSRLWNGEREMTVERELKEVSENYFEGDWYQYDLGNRSGIPDFQGTITLIRHSDSTYTGKVYMNGRWLKDILLTPRRHRKWN